MSLYTKCLECFMMFASSKVAYFELVLCSFHSRMPCYSYFKEFFIGRGGVHLSAPHFQDSSVVSHIYLFLTFILLFLLSSVSGWEWLGEC